MRVHFEQGIATAKAIGGLILGSGTTSRLLGAKAMPQAFYAVEVAQPSEVQLRRLSTALADAMAPRKSTHRIPVLTLTVAAPSNAALHPEVAVLARRAAAIRRAIAKRPELINILYGMTLRKGVIQPPYPSILATRPAQPLRLPVVGAEPHRGPHWWEEDPSPF